MEVGVNMNDFLSKAIVRLYNQERFYAELVLQMDRIISNKVPTAGVCVKERVQLYVNPEFFQGLTLTEQVAVLKHECQHILNNHIERAKEIHPEIYAKDKDAIDSFINQSKHMVINIAADCSINSGIPNIPASAVLPKQFDLKDGETLEWYLENLKNNDKLKDLTHFDDHSLWGESEDDKDQLKEKIKQAVNQAAKNTRSCGHMTSDMELLVDRLNYKAKDWKSDLKRFAAKTIETSLMESRKKRNRRYGISQPGFIKEEKLHIGVAIDTSGSISDDALNQFMAEIAVIAKYATVTVVEADSEVKSSYLFDAKKTYKIKGRGGTAYQPAFDFFTKNTDVDGVIYLGDMDCFEEKLNKPRYPVLWAVIGAQSPPAEWGMRTKIEVVKK